ncbi:DUF3995 domain-containing protein [Hymenobacter saemangeumensis]|uniref:DUF3995 domain-containing protein n=1 Tax=Hymenobacter saemangeumensis TaxID=1084522 RepID=A0ABP8IAK2_9BACT
MPLFNTLVFAFLAALHLYWALGNKAAPAALPAHPDGRLVLRPGRGLTLLVAAGLLVFAGLSAAGAGWLPLPFPASWVRAGNAAVAVLLLLRVVGDFRYVGLSKRVTGTSFATNDTRYYTPLCLLLALSTLLGLLHFAS